MPNFIRNTALGTFVPMLRNLSAFLDAAEAHSARLGAEAPDWAEARIAPDMAATLAYVESAPAAAFEGAAEREITIPLMDTLILEVTGEQMVRDWSLPNFYFHTVTAYDILRQHGVELGKRDFMSHIAPMIRQRGAA